MILGQSSLICDFSYSVLGGETSPSDVQAPAGARVLLYFLADFHRPVFILAQFFFSSSTLSFNPLEGQQRLLRSSHRVQATLKQIATHPHCPSQPLPHHKPHSTSPLPPPYFASPPHLSPTCSSGSASLH